MNALSALSQQTEGGLMMLLDMFSGGAFFKCLCICIGYHALYFCFYRSAVTWHISLISKITKRGESGRKKMNQITRYLTVGILFSTKVLLYLGNLKMQMGNVFPEGWYFIVSSVIILAAGSMFVLWLGERITEKGLGNGISFIILVGIIAEVSRSYNRRIFFSIK